MKKIGFTLAEVLITLAIIGVVAALTIPSVVANTQQQEFKTGLKKAVSVLNSAITMNMALEGETPYDNKNLYFYMMKHMSVIKSDIKSPVPAGENYGNVSFYTTDGMRYEFPHLTHTTFTKDNRMKLYENRNVALRPPIYSFVADGTEKIGWLSGYVLCNNDVDCARCGSYGLTNNPDNNVNAPCLVIVDVNGDRKPFPQNASCHRGEAPCASKNVRKFSDPNGKKLTDTFPIMITDKQAIPYGTAAQKAMYEAQK